MNEESREQSQNVPEDIESIREAEQILREYPAPEPGRELLIDIKAKIAQELLREKPKSFRLTIRKIAAIAAAFFVLAALNVKLFEKLTGLNTASIIPAAIWESEDLANDDVDLAVLTEEVEQIESELLSLQLDENGLNGETYVEELETELIEINSTFWKG